MRQSGLAQSPSRSGAYYVLFLLSLTGALAFLDRAVIGLVIEPIKATFSIDDAGAGLLTGLAFVLVYGLCGLPFAHLTDRFQRKPILAGSLGVWTLGTMVGGLAQTIPQLFASRMLVGIGEAGGTPPAVSMIADIFNEQDRPQALSVYRAAGQLGLILGLPAAGLVSDLFGWRMALMGVGAVGIPVVALLLVTMREPRRGAMDLHVPAAAMPLGAALKQMLSNGVFVALLIACTMFGIFGAISGSWGPAFFMRVHGLSAAATGASFGVALGLPAALGTLVGGVLATLLMRRYDSHRIVLVGLAAAALLSAVPQFMFTFHPDIGVVLVAGGLAAFVGCFWSGPLLAILMALVPPASRGLAAGLSVIAFSLLPGVIAPVTVGLVSDMLAPTLGVDSLRYALIIQPVSLLLAGAVLLVAARFMPAGERQAEAGASDLPIETSLSVGRPVLD